VRAILTGLPGERTPNEFALALAQKSRSDQSDHWICVLTHSTTDKLLQQTLILYYSKRGAVDNEVSSGLRKWRFIRTWR